MRLEQAQRQTQTQTLREPETEPDLRYIQVEGDPFYRQVEIVQAQTEILGSARRRGLEQEQEQYP